MLEVPEVGEMPPLFLSLFFYKEDVGVFVGDVVGPDPNQPPSWAGACLVVLE